MGSSVLLLRKILLEVLLCKDFGVSKSATECVLGRKNGRKSVMCQICGGLWRLLLESAERGIAVLRVKPAAGRRALVFWPPGGGGLAAYFGISTESMM